MDEQGELLVGPDRARVAIKDPEHLKRWLDATNRRWLVLDSLELVDALPWPHGINALMQVIDAYRGHRQTIPSGHTDKVASPDGSTVEVPRFKSDVLEVEEMDRAIRYLIQRVSERDPKWALSNPPL